MIGHAYVPGGGGSGKAMAALAVEYPDGASCFVSKGSKKITARGNNSRSLFLLPEIGTWSVTTIVDGVSRIRDVVFDKEYTAKTLLYDLDVDVFTGLHKLNYRWAGAQDANTTETIVSRGINFHSGDGNSGDVIITDEPYDITQFNTLNITYIVSDDEVNKYYGANLDAGSRLAVFHSRNKTAEATAKEITIMKQDQVPVKNQETIMHASLDVSDLTGEYYLGVKAYCPNDFLFQFTVQRLWLS